MPRLEFYDPSGKMDVTQAHAPRLTSLAGRRIGILSNGQWQAFRMVPMLKAMLEADFPDAKILVPENVPQGIGFDSDETLALVRRGGFEAVIVGNAAGGAPAIACGRIAARIEASGIPTVTLARNDFAEVVRHAVSGLGFAPDIAMVTFPIAMFLPDADLAPLSMRKQDLYDALTRWKPAAAQTGTGSMLSVDGESCEDAFEKANDLLVNRLWGDGLPLWPATPQRVEWILRGSAFPKNQVFGKFPPRGAIVTADACAIALAMAGGRPEYLPVLMAIVEAFLDPAALGDQLQATSGGPFPVVVVNGPIARRIGLNSGFGCFGPDPRQPAGASIGRALRLLQQNLGGALPGTGTMAVFGVMRQTNAVFAEDEEGLPGGWPPYGAERHGFATGANCVSLAFVNGAANIFHRGARRETKEEDALTGLRRIAAYLRVPNMHYIYGYEGTPGIVVISRVLASALASLGWTKTSVREFLWEQSRIPLRDMRQVGGDAFLEIASNAAARASAQYDPWPITSKPFNIGLVVAGGEHSSHSLWLQAFSPAVTGREIRLPDKFGELLAQSS